MSIKVRPLSKQDLSISMGEVRNLIGSGSNESSYASNVESISIFGTAVHEGEEQKRYEDPYIKMGHIKLAIPVLNPFLAGESGAVWQKVIGRHNEPDIEDIVKGNKFYNVKEGKGVHVSQMHGVYTERDWLVGGQYLRHILDNLDVEKEIEDLIYERYVYPTLSPRGKDGQPSWRVLWKTEHAMAGEITKGSGYCWLVDDYYYTSHLPDYKYSVLEENVEKVAEETFNQHMDRLVLLLSLRANKNQFRDQVQDFVMVMPVGYRPRIEGGADPLSKQYNLLVKASNDLREVIAYANIDIKTVQMRYKEMYNRVVNIMVGSDQIYNADTYSPLLESLSHKTGLIRGYMQATRIDNSGRTVIVSDLEMPLDCIGLPKSMVAKLCEADVLESWNSNAENKAYVMSKKWDSKRMAEAIRIIEGDYVVIGRQPTLHYLSMQGFKVIVVEGNAIVLNPLVVMPFNADFDGDQMHVNRPQTTEAKEEVRRLMSSTNNLFYPKNGEVTPVPRHEMLYGLFIASTVVEGRNPARNWTKADIPSLEKEFNSQRNLSLPEAIYEGVCTQRINVYDTVDIPYEGCTCGKVAIKYCLGNSHFYNEIGVVPISGNRRTNTSDGSVTAGWCKAVLQDIAEKESRSYFVDVVNKLVRLGYAVAEIFPPTISLINIPDATAFIKEFEKNIRKREELFNSGFETNESFTTYYTEEYSKLEKSVKSYLTSTLGPTSGWLRMVTSGARGSMSNILQLFGFKGRITKSKTEVFNVCLESSIKQGMTGLESLVTSYGARQGIVDKVVATDRPGYLSRKIKHTCATVYITQHDCGTDNGLLLTYDDILQFIPSYQLTDDDAFNNSSVKPYFCKLLVGRYVQPGSVYVDNIKQAEDFYDAYVADIQDGQFVKKSGIKMRSPITCSNPCCAKCYGRELGTMTKHPAVGHPIGFVAALAIGEPGTQLTMNSFHKGGVAGVGGLTSSFDKISDYLHLYSLRKDGTDEPIRYDFISPVEGDVKEVYLGFGTKEVKIMSKGADGYKNRLRSRVIVYEDVELKPYVKKGDSIQKIQGDLDIREVKRERGIDEAQKYLVLQLYDTFNNEVDISMKHFEVVVAGMTYYVCLKGDGGYYKTGCYYKQSDLYNHPAQDVPFIKTLKGIKEVPKFNRDFIASMSMEDIGSCVRRGIILNPEDSMTDPIVRMSFGMNYGLGSDVGDYLYERGNI